MAKTIKDLSDAVKRFLTSNTNLVNLIPGAAQNGEVLMVQIDASIMEAANSARVNAEKLHDFAANDAIGRTVLSFGAPIDLDRVPTKRFFSGTGSRTFTAAEVKGIESSLTDWPELTLKVSALNESIDVSTVLTVAFGGTVHYPIVAGYEYTVINTKLNLDGTVSLALGIAPGVLLNVTNSTVIFNTGECKRFKTIKSAWLVGNNVMRPIKVQKLQSKMIRLMKDQGMVQSHVFPRDGEVMFAGGNYEATIDGRILTISPTTDKVEVAVNGNVWMEPYTSHRDTDFLLDNGFEYMMWETIIEVNFMLLKYVSRQEGTISPPTQARDAAWEALVLWDSHSIDGNIYFDL